MIAEPLGQGHDTRPCLPRTPLLPIILADDFLCSLPDGTLLDRKQFLEYTARPATISDLAVHDVNVRLMGDFAIVHARTTFTLAGGQAAKVAIPTYGRAEVERGWPSRPTSPVSSLVKCP